LSAPQLLAHQRLGAALGELARDVVVTPASGHSNASGSISAK
jgi:hypothetical protein